MANTIATLQTRLLYYFQKAGVSPDLLQGSADMTLDALNDARKEAEQLYAFEMNKKSLELSAVVGSQSWLTARQVGTSTDFSVRSIKKVWKRATDGGLTEIPIEYKSLVDLGNTSTGYDEKIAFVGSDLYILPVNTTAYTLQFDGYVWMADYTDPTNTDWMVLHGANYLFWKAAYLLNHRMKEFVPRQEGNVSFSDAFVMSKFQALVAWDNQLKNGGFQLLP